MAKAKKEVPKKQGYIALYRSIKNHWVWEQGRKRTRTEAWLDLLMLASHDGSKTPIGKDLIMIERGQILTSLEKLGKEWLWDRSAVRTFLKLLEKDKMLTQTSTHKYTILTLTNYDFHQFGETVNLRENHSKTTGEETLEKQSATHTIMYKNVEEGINNVEENKSAAAVSVFQKFLEVYEKFLIEKTGSGEKFSIAGRAALTTILKYYTTSIAKDNTTKQIQESEEQIEARALAGWEYVLGNFDKWGDFYQQQLKLEQINSNLTNILAAIKSAKNGTGNKHTGAKGSGGLYSTAIIPEQRNVWGE